MKSKGDLILKVILGVLVAVLAVVIVRGLRERVVAVGDAAPDFHVTTQDGKQVSLRDYAGKVLVLNFWASWCEPCVAEAPSLNEFAKEAEKSGVMVLGISSDRNTRLYNLFRERFHVAFPTAQDPDGGIAADYGTYLIPETYIIDKNGKVVRKIVNSYNWTDPEMVRFVTSL